VRNLTNALARQNFKVATSNPDLVNMSCVHVGSTNADIAGLGVILSFAAQGGISLALSAWSFFLLDIERSLSSLVNDVKRNWNIDETKKEIRKLKREKIGTVLATIADTQVLTGIFELIPHWS
jgi:hypothetical protein